MPLATTNPKPTRAPSAEGGRLRKPLAELRPGQTGVVHDLESNEADAAVLRAMGLRGNARVRLCRAGEPCIVSILSGSAEQCSEGCRIGLARPLALRVLVDVD